MTDNQTATIYGASDDLIEFDGAIYGEASWPRDDAAKVTLKAPDGTKMRLRVQFCGPGHPDGWLVAVDENPGGWSWERFDSNPDDEDADDVGVRVMVPQGTTAKCNGEKVR